MQQFETFRRSVEPLKDKVVEAQQFTPQTMGSAKWSVLNEVFRGIKGHGNGNQSRGQLQGDAPYDAEYRASN